jgi:hemolysin III
VDSAATPEKPALRGWSHAVATVPAIAGTALLLVAARPDRALQLSLLVYGVALFLLFAVSAMYHLPSWSPSWKARWRRFDHAMIFIMIAGTYTPIVGNLIEGWPRVTILATIWSLALAGVALCISPLQLPRAAFAITYVAVGWVAIAAMPVLVQRLGINGLLFLLAGGALYSTGAIVYALRRPRLWPSVFGYHAVFHLLVIAATAVYFAFIATDVVAAHRV